MGPRGFNGTQGPQGPQGEPGIGNFSLCKFDQEKATLGIGRHPDDEKVDVTVTKLLPVSICQP